MPKEVSIVTGANSGIGRYSGSWTMMMMTRTSAIGVLFLTNKNKMTTTIMVS